ncbi:MAG: chromosome segregation protein SMC, partial [Planctomycetes bacterium]|nr:chromosome segregation protein SMC [Planctomycetota bacterium]
RAQSLVIRQLDPLIEYLNGDSAEISGRVGFLQCSRPDQDETAAIAASIHVDGEYRTAADVCKSADRILPIPGGVQPDLRNQPGVVKRADELAKTAEILPQLAADVLADTWIVESLEVAFTLSQQQGRGCRFVTLQGELLEADGTLIVGTPRAETALVSRKSELRKLKTDLSKLDKQISDEEQRLSQLSGELSAVDAEIGQLRAARDGAVDTHREFRSENQGRVRERKRLQSEWEQAGEERDSLAAAARKFANEIEEREMEIASAEEDLRHLTTALETGAREVSQFEHRLLLLQKRHSQEQLDLAKEKERLHAVTAAAEKLRAESQQRRLQRQEAIRRFLSVREKREQIEHNLLDTRSILAEQYLADERCLRDVDGCFAEKDGLRGKRTALSAEEAAHRHDDRELKDRLHQEEISLRDSRHRLETLAERIEEEYQVDLEDIVSSGVSGLRNYCEQRREKKSSNTPKAHAGENASESESPNEQSPSVEGMEVHSDHISASADEPEIRFEDVRPEIEAQVNRLRRKLKAMGSVNTDSLQNLDELETRYAHLSATLADLLEAKSHLEGLVRRIDVRCKELFAKTFEAIRSNFRELFRKAFGGGDGDILLEDPDDMLECGIEIVARPPGKKLKSILLMSGGEKTLTAFALLLAIFRFRPSPYCVLDEVDAALDEANVERLLAMLEEFKQSTQFVII